MPRLLHLDSSADPATSRSRQITLAFANGWRSLSTGHVVTYRDLHQDPPPHLPAAALHWGPLAEDPPDTGAAAARRLQRELVQELLDADAVVIGAPMYNFSLPSTLKAWLDHVHVMGITAGDPSTVPLQGRPAVAVISRGAAYPAGTEAALKDHVTPVVHLVLGESMGMEVHTIITDLTLADAIPSLKEHRETAAAQLVSALSKATDLARLLGLRATSEATEPDRQELR